MIRPLAVGVDRSLFHVVKTGSKTRSLDEISTTSAQY